jgi:hypothetical protein
MVPLSTVLTRIRTRYEAESGGSAIRWADPDIALFVNEGLECLAEATGFYERYATLTLESSRIYHDLRGFTPETVLSISSVFSTARNDWLVPVTEPTLDTSWEVAYGDPQCYFTRGIFWVGVYPRPAESTGSIRVYFKGIPGRLTHPQAVLGDLPDDHYPALEDYALYEMAAADGQPKRALLHWASYQKREKSLANLIDRRTSTVIAGRLGRLAGAGRGR